ncbi:MAG: GGDEF domain-containing protein [Thermoanaerobaculia bacterium]|nr:GGDEF domain-containing protein [Thermoanaerobaculia bacterium]
MRVRQHLRPWTVFLALLLVTAAYLAGRPQLLLFDTAELPALLLVVILGVVLIGLWSQARARRRLARLASVAEAIQSGDFTARCDESGGDSIASVAGSINRMAAHIDATLAQLRESEDRIREVAYRDPLTGLPNRRLFEELLEREVEAARRYEYPLAVAVMDIDNLKDVNDSLGHRSGDQLLRAVAERLVHQLRGSDVLARLAGDEFALVMRSAERREDVLSVLERVLRRCREPFELEQREIQTSLSIGLCFYPEDGSSSQELMSNADFALYRAKAAGRAKVRQFDQSMNELATTRLRMEQDLRRAMDGDELILTYQPIVALDDRRIVGLEALVRWNHPEDGLLTPDRFISLAEDAGLMPQLGYLVLMKACRHAVLWQQTGLSPVPISINVSVRQLQAGDFAERVERVLLLTGLEPQYLKLEITENIAAEGERILEHLSRLRSQGVGLAIDDFGTGYSSFSYLLEHRIDSLKIDRSFVRDLPHNADSTAIVRAILSLAERLDLEVVAEGIERPEQLELLREAGCRLGQGYLFCRPRTKADIQEILRTGSVPSGAADSDATDAVSDDPLPSDPASTDATSSDSDPTDLLEAG